MNDVFASAVTSTILAWVCSIPVVVAAIGASVGLLFDRVHTAIPRWFAVWMAICMLMFSPFRYILLQAVIAAAYPFQSIHACITTLVLAWYVPVIFGILWLLGLVLPHIATLQIAFGSLDRPDPTPGRLILGSLIAPLNCFGGYIGVIWLVQFAGYATHWLDVNDVIGATNGPAQAVYNVIWRVTPLPVRDMYIPVTRDPVSMQRNHVASYYLGANDEARYVYEAFPALYESLKAVVGDSK